MRLKQAEKFEITYKEKVVEVEVVSIGGQTLYKITFDNKSRLFLHEQKILMQESFGPQYLKANNTWQKK